MARIAIIIATPPSVTKRRVSRSTRRRRLIRTRGVSSAEVEGGGSPTVSVPTRLAMLLHLGYFFASGGGGNRKVAILDDYFLPLLRGDQLHKLMSQWIKRFPWRLVDIDIEEPRQWECA